MQDYVRDGAEIYRRSFAIIRAEADLARFSKAEERVAVRLIHACGMVEVARDIVMSPGFADNARWALIAGAPILCDSRMVANGVTRARLPAANEVVCTLSDPSVAELAARMDTTRTAAAMELWRERLSGNFSASPTYAGGKIYLQNEEGTTYVLKPGPKYQLLATNQVDGQTLASPAFVDGAIYLRSSTHLYRIEQPGNETPRNVRAAATLPGRAPQTGTRAFRR